MVVVSYYRSRRDLVNIRHDVGVEFLVLVDDLDRFVQQLNGNKR